MSGALVKAHKAAEAPHGPTAADLGDQVERESLAVHDGEKHCAVSNEWIANRLVMGHHAGMSKVVKLYQDSTEGQKLMAKYKKTLKSKD